MALGYEIGTIMKRCSTVWKCPDKFTIKFDDIEGMPSTYVQIQVCRASKDKCRCLAFRVVRANTSNVRRTGCAGQVAGGNM